MNTGALRIRVRWQDGRIGALTSELERPPVTRLLQGRSAAEALAAVPLLHALCSQAQAAAAAAALAAAAGQPSPLPPHRALWLEALHEHLWRLLLDWPRALGLEPPREAFAAWRKQRQAPDTELFAATRPLFQRDLGLTEAGQVQPAGLAARCLAALGQAPELPAAAIGLPDPAPWLAGPGSPATGPGAIATPPGPGLAYARRLAEALAAWQALAAGAPFPVRSAGRDGRGLGLAWTARGLLLHDVRLEADGRVAGYRIQAPTDRLFASTAPLARQLEALPGTDAAGTRRNLELAILALDPCVPWRIDWTEN